MTKFVVRNDDNFWGVGVLSNDDWSVFEDSQPHIYMSEDQGIYCCGIGEWGDFCERDQDKIPEGMVVELLEAILEYSRKRKRGLIRLQFNKRVGEDKWRNAVLMNAVQNYEGFTAISSFTNPNTGNQIMEFQYELVNVNEWT